LRAKDFLSTYIIFEPTNQLFEVAMNPSNLKRLAKAIPGVQVGMEFEMVVPDVQVDDDEYDSEPDYDQDESVSDIDDIVRFFGSDDDYRGQVNYSGDLRRLEEELREGFAEWISDKIQKDWESTDGGDFFDTWIRENVDPDVVSETLELGDDLFGNPVAPKKEDWEQFIEAEWDEQGKYYDQAKEAFEEERRDEGDFDENEYLSDIGIRRMSDVESNVSADIQWPFYSHPESGSEAIDDVADDFSRAIGKKVYSSDSYHGARRADDAYSLEPDTSINTSSGEAGLEFISPPMPIDEMFEDLKKVKHWADSRGAYTDKSTGLHINVSVPGYSLDKLDYVKLAVLLGDQYVLDQFGRLGTQWAKSAFEIVQRRAKDNPEDADRLLKQVKSGVETIASKIIHTGHTDKYTSINTKDNYVEFRGPGGDWLDRNFDKIENTLLRFVVALDAACDPNKYKKEYYKGLYKVLKPTNANSDMGLFAKYMAGQITRSELMKELETTRKERFRGQGIRILQKDEVEEGDWEVTYDNGTTSESIYIANTDKVPDDDAAFNVAKKYKPAWFKPGTIENITVKPYSYGEELDELKMYSAEYRHKYTGVVAKDEEEAKEKLHLMDPDLFTAYPDTEITLTDQNETSRRKLYAMLEWQKSKIKIGEAWLARPKIWLAVGGSSRFYIAAISRDEALDVATKLDPEITNSDRFEIYVSDQYPGADTYQAYQTAQNDLIQARQRERELTQQSQDETIDVSKLKTYRVSNMNGYRYIVAENGAEAAELATQLEPDKFPEVQSLTVQDQSHLSSTSNPTIIRSMYVSQQQTLGSNRDTSRGQVDQYSVYEASNGRGDRMFIAARTPVEAHTLAARLYPDVFNDEIRTERYGDATQMDAARLLRQQATRQQQMQPRLAHIGEYRVTNMSTGDSRYFTGSSEQDAIERARQEYPALFTNGNIVASTGAGSF